MTAFGAFTTPLPRALLGATRPLRAFVGHVEPTFDWTLRQRQTGEHLTFPLEVSSMFPHRVSRSIVTISTNRE